MDNQNYDETISTSKEESLLKALQIFYESEQANCKKVERPDINVAKTLAKVLSVVLGYIILPVATFLIFKETQLYWVLVVCLAVFLLFVVLTFKRTVINSVLLYQKLAPERIRSSCVFTPTCSEYMLLAIDKYGVCKGVVSGIKRLLRCRPSNGGVDYP